MISCSVDPTREDTGTVCGMLDLIASKKKPQASLLKHLVWLDEEQLFSEVDVSMLEGHSIHPASVSVTQSRHLH